MARTPPRDPKSVASFSELRSHYTELIRQLDDCKRMRSAATSTLRDRSKEVRGVQADLKKAKGEVALITKKAAAAKSLRETSGWSAAAIGATTLGFTAMQTYGYPGPTWLFEHDIFYGWCCWAMTSIFAWAAKSFYGSE